MIEFIDLLSGGVPGGILLLIFLIVAIIIFFRLLKSSQILSKRQSNKQQIVFSFILIFIYITLWFALRPPLHPQRIVVLPTRNGSENIEIDDNTFKLAEMIQRYARGNLNERYILHRWEWILETVGADSAMNYTTWLRTAKNIGADYLIESHQEKQNSEYQFEISKIENKMANETILQGSMTIEQFIYELDQNLNVFTLKRSLPDNFVKNYIQAKAMYWINQYDKSLILVKNNNDLDSRVLAALIYMQKGLQIKFDRVKAQFVKFENKEFVKSKKIINTVLKEDKDWPGIAYVLGKIALREGDYLKADTYLKKAFVDDYSDCRIHLALSYLLPERLEEIGYQNRIEILERAVSIDPGFKTAVYELAKEYFESGTGTPTGTGTTMALNLMEKFFKINNSEPRILGLLASVYLRISKLDDAQVLFEKLLKMYPENSDNYYNLGVVYFQKKDFTKALDYFLKAIEIDKNLDSYLYVAVIYRELGKQEKALKYFRERVKRMTGEDDQYAREAMQGIRTVLEEMKSDSSDAN